MHEPPPRILERIHASLVEHENGCVTSELRPSRSTYAELTWKDDDGQQCSINMHHAIWWERHGTIPDGMLVRRTCNTTGCVSLKHLHLVSQYLSPAVASQHVQQLIALGWTSGEICRHTGVHGNTVRELQAGVRERVTPETEHRILSMELTPPSGEAPMDPSVLQRIISGEKVAIGFGSKYKLPYVRALMSLGWNRTRISTALGCSGSTIVRMEALISQDTTLSPVETDKEKVIANLTKRTADLAAEIDKWSTAYFAAVEREKAWQAIAMEHMTEEELS